MSDHEKNNWQSILANAITDPEQLFQQLQLHPTDLSSTRQACKTFPLKVPTPYLKKMKPGDPNDPLLLQVLPLSQELIPIPGFIKDPLQESEFTPIPGMLHKYEGRALLITSPTCVVNCRYCFRRHFPYQDHYAGINGWKSAIQYIADTPSINEVILSGGDPLIINNQRLQQLIQQLEQIPHLQRLRIHTRFPVMVPQRIDPPFVKLLSNTRLQKVIVLHINHANEMDDVLGNALLKLKSLNVTLLNQSVLLKNINNNVQSLRELSEKLFQYHILPYYLHMLDPVEGAAHFQVCENEAIKLLSQLRTQLPGFLVPKLVKEQAFMPNKTPIEANRPI